MPYRVPTGTITNTGAFNKNLVVTTKQVNGYNVYSRPTQVETLGQFIANAIIEDAILTLGGGALMATETGIRLARLATLVAKGVARGAKVAKTAVQGTKIAKNTAKAIKTAKTTAGKAKTAVKKSIT